MWILLCIRNKIEEMLRDYQIDICSRVSEAFEHHRSVMVQMPTGTGKTMVLAELVKQLMMKDEGGKDSDCGASP